MDYCHEGRERRLGLHPADSYFVSPAHVVGEDPKVDATVSTMCEPFLTAGSMSFMLFHRNLTVIKL